YSIASHVLYLFVQVSNLVLDIRDRLFAHFLVGLLFVPVQLGLCLPLLFQSCDDIVVLPPNLTGESGKNSKSSFRLQLDNFHARGNDKPF
uniref:Uncharacterized protein n=1 Tax=Ciona savignyi TaxID=51511 RepID=H2Y787_CIOSA